jgi:hypothetical protein
LRAGDLGEQIAGQRATGRSSEDGVEIALQRAPFGAQRRSGDGFDIAASAKTRSNYRRNRNGASS